MIALLLEIFSLLSRFLNVLTGGTADMTFSARSHVQGLWTEPVINWFAKVLFNEDDHCAVWWLAEVVRSRNNISLYEARTLLD